MEFFKYVLDKKFINMWRDCSASSTITFFIYLFFDKEFQKYKFIETP